MADAATSLADALFTTTQQRVLGLLFGQPQRSFTVSELITAAGAGSGAVQREVTKLAESGLLTMQPTGNQKHYQANPDAPVYEELVGIVQKTVGMAQPLRTALAPLTDRTQVPRASIHRLQRALAICHIGRGHRHRMRQSLGIHCDMSFDA